MKCQRKYKLGLVLGRFQGFHVGHEHLINSAKSQCENLLILIGSPQEDGTVRNPFNIFIRWSMLSDMYRKDPNIHIGEIFDMTHENDHSHEWGKYLLSIAETRRLWFGIEEKLDVIFTGDDECRESWFDPIDIKGIDQVKIARSEIPVSATQIRGYLAWNNYELWSKHTNPVLHGYYDSLRKQLYEVRG